VQCEQLREAPTEEARGRRLELDGVGLEQSEEVGAARVGRDIGILHHLGHNNLRRGSLGVLHLACRLAGALWMCSGAVPAGRSPPHRHLFVHGLDEDVLTFWVRDRGLGGVSLLSPRPTTRIPSQRSLLPPAGMCA
jgi:hypothetical protein